ncbi:putative dehydrogenase-related protein [Archaeoglobus sulfaticallidus PM70-1]|uniref:Putative dehydrogenase-related protein n=1 Tax=Archaeoglobus sulfaticallidus PM70-1 TaxID=387631 RepID=N0BIV4_9EURY|nr:bi-domain-containing oxidoreductase [Archaeoglobus sulfaticallidus]AGK60065.1 putative dehydrogenase-related protein [Archaeoglobus sulfaticallidus PM70-1]
MKQVVLDFSTGEIKLVNVPTPLVRPRRVLVKNVISVVSIGTEKNMIDFARKNTISKALSRPDLTKQVLDFAKSEGWIEAYKQAKRRLASPEPLGYSSAGIVIDVGNSDAEFRKGDRVACTGSGFASHAEIISVPYNLCVKIPENVSFDHASFAGVGAIAVHAIRLASLQPGENVCIIGLGLLGLLAVQIAKASGYNVLGVDVSEPKLKLAKELGADEVSNTKDAIKVSRIFSDGYGMDAVIIFASTKSDEPIELASEIARERGKIVVPGLVGLDIPREVFYKKELELVVSRSFGPGVYDPFYELKGVDYPYPYVRWTVKRNMKYFLELVSEGKIDLDKIITHRFKIDEAEKAYEELLKGTNAIGVLFYYDYLEGEPKAEIIKVKTKKKKDYKKDKINVGLIGAGNFAKGTILPIIKKIPYVNLVGVATATGTSAEYMARKFDFDYCTTNYMKILEDPNIDCVVIATRHDLHARISSEALEHDKDVFVEKPMALTSKELKRVIEAYNSSDGKIMVGFNRRFSPLCMKAKETIGCKEPLALNIRVNAGKLPSDSWVYDPAEGGGRILGEVCHFVDLAIYFTESSPKYVYAQAIDAPHYSADDNVLVNISFENGSIASILYVSNGDRAFSRERVEIFGNNAVAVIDNFKSLVVSKDGKKKKMKNWFGVDRGHKSEFEIFFSSIKGGKDIPVKFEEYVHTTITTFKILKSLKEGQPIKIEVDI